MSVFCIDEPRFVWLTNPPMVRGQQDGDWKANLKAPTKDLRPQTEVDLPDSPSYSIGHVLRKLYRMSRLPKA